MDAQKVIMGKRLLIVDDEKDVLDTLKGLLELCKIDTATSFEDAKKLLEKNFYHIAILDIMGVNGFELLQIANQRGVPALMLTAHALTPESLKKSAEKGAAFFAPKEEMKNIAVFVADVLETKEMGKNPWVRWYERMGGFFDAVFTGPNWREREKDFWEKQMHDY